MNAPISTGAIGLLARNRTTNVVVELDGSKGTPVGVAAMEATPSVWESAVDRRVRGRNTIEQGLFCYTRGELGKPGNGYLRTTLVGCCTG
jgi:hypothetical protein